MAGSIPFQPLFGSQFLAGASQLTQYFSQIAGQTTSPQSTKPRAPVSGDDFGTHSHLLSALTISGGDCTVIFVSTKILAAKVIERSQIWYSISKQFLSRTTVVVNAVRAQAACQGRRRVAGRRSRRAARWRTASRARRSARAAGTTAWWARSRATSASAGGATARAPSARWSPSASVLWPRRSRSAASRRRRRTRRATTVSAAHTHTRRSRWLSHWPTATSSSRTCALCSGTLFGPNGLLQINPESVPFDYVLSNCGNSTTDAAEPLPTPPAAASTALIHQPINENGTTNSTCVAITSPKKGGSRRRTHDEEDREGMHRVRVERNKSIHKCTLR